MDTTCVLVRALTIVIFVSSRLQYIAVNSSNPTDQNEEERDSGIENYERTTLTNSVNSALDKLQNMASKAEPNSLPKKDVSNYMTFLYERLNVFENGDYLAQFPGTEDYRDMSTIIVGVEASLITSDWVVTFRLQDVESLTSISHVQVVLPTPPHPTSAIRTPTYHIRSQCNDAPAVIGSSTWRGWTIAEIPLSCIHADDFLVQLEHGHELEQIMLLLFYDFTNTAYSNLYNLSVSFNPRTKRQVPAHDTETIKCRLVEWKIDFDQVNMGWIMKPKDFSANFCTGMCIEPLLGKYLNTTNHAFFKSIVRGMSGVGGNDLVPASQCVPTRFGSLVVVYKTSDKQSTMATIRQVVASQCGCL